MDCSLLGFSVLGILQARILDWVDIPFSRRSSQLRDRTQVFLSYCRWFLYYLSHLVCFLSNWEEENQVSSAPTTLTSSCTDLLPSLCARNEGQPLLLWSTPRIWPSPITWPPVAKNWLTGKDSDAGKDWGSEKGVTEDEMINRVANSMDMFEQTRR